MSDSISSEVLRQQLQDAQLALDGGHATQARHLAGDTLGKAESTGDVRLQAQSLAFLAHCDRLTSRFRSAYEASQRAALLSRQLSDMDGEARALSTLSYVASALGRNEDAVEAGLLCTHLASLQSDVPLMAVAHNNLGVARFWGGQFEMANAAFETALHFAERSGSAMSAFQPALNMACAESYRLARERFHSGELPDPTRFASLVDTALGYSARIALQGGMAVTSSAMAAIYLTLKECWSGHPADAMRRMTQARDVSARYQAVTWLDALVDWVEGEIHLAQRDYDNSELAMHRLVATAGAMEHEQLACVGHMLLCQVYELKGLPELAMAESRRLIHRRTKIDEEALASREKLVAWQLQARAQEEQLQTLRRSSAVLEQLALQDPLTGLANRRKLEQDLERLLAEASTRNEELAVAFIDVDKFKRVNDDYSHQIGDAVLKELAVVLRAQVRENDVAGRYAGDEFILLLPRTSPERASAIAKRVSYAVSAYPFDQLHPGLKISVSVGVTAMAPLDTVSTLLGRADSAMYRDKRRAR